MNQSTNRIHLVSFALLTLLCISLTGCGAASGSKVVGQPAPFYTNITKLNGDTVSLEQYRGRPLVMVFWATTCMYSPRAVEKINGWAPKLKAQGVQFLALSIDKGNATEEVKKFITVRDMAAFDHAFSGNDIYDEAYIRFDGGELPYIVVIDAQGKVAAVGTKASVIEDYFQL